MIEENNQKLNRIKDLQTSKIILCKLIQHYSYNSIVDYLFNPDKISNPKLESIMKRLINKMGISNLAFLLCNENLNSYNINKEKEKEEEKSVNKSNNDINIGQNKYKTFLIKKKYKNKLLNRENNFNKKILFHKYYYKNKKQRNIKLDEDDDENSSDVNSISSNNNINKDSESNDDNSNINDDSSNDSENKNCDNSYNNSLNDFNEFCDSDINKENIINLVNEMEEEEDESNEIKKEDIKEEEKEIILDDTNSYVYKIIYRSKSGELNYYCFEKLNEDETITMHCIDELCKSKGIYNPKNKQIMIILEHTIEYEEHCFFKINFGGKELDLEIFDFIKDNPEITGIEVLKMKEEIKIKEEKKEDNMDIEMNIKKEKTIDEENEDINMVIKKEKEDDNSKDKEENENMSVKKEYIDEINEENIDEIKKENSYENNLIDNEESNKEKETITENKNDDLGNSTKKKNEPIYQNRICNNIIQINKKVKNKEKVNPNEKKDLKESFTLFNLNFNTNKNNIRTKKLNNNKNNEQLKEIDFIQKNDLKNSIDSNKLTNEESNNYNFVEFNIDNIKKYEGTENCYSKKVDMINLENKKFVEEQNKLIEKNKRNKSKTGLRKLKEKINQQEKDKEKEIEKEKIISQSSTPSYLMNEENKETDNENNIEIEESEYSKLSVVSHFQDNIEEKIIIGENDSIFSSLEIMSLKEQEKYDKRINDDIISISEEFFEKRRKKFEKMQKKLQERQLSKYLKKKEPQRRSLFRVNERKIRSEDEVNIPNKRRVFGITRRSMSPLDIKMEKIEEEEEKKEKVIEDENANNKKGMPIFGIFNPIKHNPIFFINNNFNRK